MHRRLGLLVLIVGLLLVGCRGRDERIRDETALLASRLGVAPERLRYVGRGEHDGPQVQDRWSLSGGGSHPTALIATLGTVRGELVQYWSKSPEGGLPLAGPADPAAPATAEAAVRSARAVMRQLVPGRPTRLELASQISPQASWVIILEDECPTRGMPQRWYIIVNRRSGAVTQIN
jgi:hypothetical protein